MLSRHHRPRLLASLFLAALALLGAAVLFHRYAPKEHNPFKPLALADPIGMATYHKLTAISHDAAACFALLDEGGIAYSRLEDSAPGKACGFYDALTLDQSAYPYSANLRMSCPLTAALAIWEKQVVAPAAEKHLDASITRIETYGSFNCRRIGGGTRGRWSEHATANAIDIAGFRLSDGALITVSRHWKAKDSRGAFLREVRQGACRLFSVTLSPDYNAAHADHLHLDMGGGDICN